MRGEASTHILKVLTRPFLKWKSRLELKCLLIEMIDVGWRRQQQRFLRSRLLIRASSLSFSAVVFREEDSSGGGGCLFPLDLSAGFLRVVMMMRREAHD